MRLLRSIKTRQGKLDPARVRALWVRFRHYIRPHRWALIGSLAGALGVVGTQVLAPWPIKIILDHLLFEKMDASSWIVRALSAVSSGKTGALAWICGAVLLLAVGDAVFSYLRDVLLALTGQRVVGKIRQDLFRHLQTLAPSDFARYHTGNVLTRLTRDIQMLREMMVTAVIQAIESILLIGAMIAVMFWVNPKLALLGVATIPIALWASLRISRQIRKATAKQREKESEIASLAHDVIGGLSVVQAFNREKIEQKRFTRQNRSSIRAGVKCTRLEAKLYRIVSFASAVGMCAILFVGVRTVLAGEMTPGDLMVFVAYVRAVNKPMRKIAKLAARVAKATACGQRVAELFALVPSVQDRPDAKPLQSVAGRLDFVDVGFAYDSHAAALSAVNLSIQPGERIAIVGHTGAGKTTLAKLILRFHDPQSGSVRIDDTDIRDVTIESLRQNVGWVHQDTVLFGMSVAENISLGRPDAGSAEIRAVAKVVHADEFVEALRHGYKTVLGQGGATLSGGERQRIALARALLREPAILLLDEPASGLDPITRQSVERAWMSEENTATTLVICHRLRDMDRFDRVVVLARGRVVECGPHAALIGENGEYAAMYAAAGEGDRSDAASKSATC